MPDTIIENNVQAFNAQFPLMLLSICNLYLRCRCKAWYFYSQANDLYDAHHAKGCPLSGVALRASINSHGYPQLEIIKTLKDEEKIVVCEDGQGSTSNNENLQPKR